MTYPCYSRRQCEFLCVCIVSPQRHYLEWNIPKGLIESLCLKESLPTIVMPPPPKVTCVHAFYMCVRHMCLYTSHAWMTCCLCYCSQELSPMHSVEKYHWVKKLTGKSMHAPSLASDQWRIQGRGHRAPPSPLLPLLLQYSHLMPCKVNAN